MDTEDVVATLEKEPLRTRSDMHKRPPKLWIDILSTKKLWAPTIMPSGSKIMLNHGYPSLMMMLMMRRRVATVR